MGAHNRGKHGRQALAAQASPFLTSRITPPRSFTGFRDKSIPVRATVGCPTCGVAAGEPCKTLRDGSEMGSSHPTRRRAAIRKLREEAELAEPDPSKD